MNFLPLLFSLFINAKISSTKGYSFLLFLVINDDIKTSIYLSPIVSIILLASSLEILSLSSTLIQLFMLLKKNF